MSSVAEVGERLQFILEKRADELAKETGCIKRERKFSGADVVQTLVFGWQQHPHASLESWASTAEVRAVSVSDTAVQKRFTPECAQFLHAILQEMSRVVVQAAHVVPIKLLRRFRAVILEDSSSSSLPEALAEIWQGCGGNPAHTAAAVKRPVRLRTQARTGARAEVDRWTPLRSRQPVQRRRSGGGQSVDQGFGVLQLAADGRAASSQRLHPGALASRHRAVHAQRPPSAAR